MRTTASLIAVTAILALPAVSSIPLGSLRVDVTRPRDSQFCAEEGEDSAEMNNVNSRTPHWDGRMNPLNVISGEGIRALRICQSQYPWIRKTKFAECSRDGLPSCSSSTCSCLGVLFPVCCLDGTLRYVKTGLKLPNRDLKISRLDCGLQIRVDKREIITRKDKRQVLRLSGLQVDFCKTGQPLSRWQDRGDKVA